MGVWLCQKSISFDEIACMPSCKTLAGRIQHGHIAVPFDCFLGDNHPGLDIRLKTDVGEDEVDPFSALKHSERLVECTRRKRSMADVLKYSFCEYPDLVLVFDYQYSKPW